MKNKPQESTGEQSVETGKKDVRRHPNILQLTDEERERIDALLGRNQHGYLIRIAKRKDREHAIEAFMNVPFQRARVGEDSFLVLQSHVDELQKAGIPFEDISGPTEEDA